ncbi:cobalt-factor II C(20)-methyltransferase [Vibrio viridaestus]|uniref:Cobalt-factor II C(20)-methyltransferase n=1 Tax=Vibrio viridaestus TaxID=2487322 RepID=A0A3N9TJZ5_9VIBR|nr:cobalt-factor II C(20)-methyltransferase [Vibrio viridaestus]RQW64550.1 cobalt-factor II C(20)-methyltransferase [Vibrio viridaestus]
MLGQGTLYAIGTGPGASDLITVRGANILASVDVLYTPSGKRGGDSLAYKIVKEYVGDSVDVKTRHFPMSNSDNEKIQAWDAIADEIQNDVRSGRDVAFISLGDSMLFSTWVFLLERLKNKITIEIIPGISSFSAISSSSLLPMAMENQTMAVVPCTIEVAKIEQALLDNDVVILMKVYGRFAMIRGILNRLNLLDHAVLMANATMDGEIMHKGLASLNDEQELPYFSTVIVNKSELA